MLDLDGHVLFQGSVSGIHVYPGLASMLDGPLWATRKAPKCIRMASLGSELVRLQGLTLIMLELPLHRFPRRLASRRYHWTFHYPTASTLFLILSTPFSPRQLRLFHLVCLCSSLRFVSSSHLTLPFTHSAISFPTFMSLIAITE